MLRDSHRTYFGFIRSFFLCFFICFFVLDPLSFSLAFVSSPLPSDLKFYCYRSTCACCCAMTTIYFHLFFCSPVALSSHMTPRCLSPAGSTFNLQLTLFPLAHSPHSLDCHPSPWTQRIKISAQPWRKLGNCGPHSLLFSAFCLISHA